IGGEMGAVDVNEVVGFGKDAQHVAAFADVNRYLRPPLGDVGIESGADSAGIEADASCDGTGERIDAIESCAWPGKNILEQPAGGASFEASDLERPHTRPPA